MPKYSITELLNIVFLTYVEIVGCKVKVEKVKVKIEGRKTQLDAMIWIWPALSLPLSLSHTHRHTHSQISSESYWRRRCGAPARSFLLFILCPGTKGSAVIFNNPLDCITSPVRHTHAELLHTGPKKNPVLQSVSPPWVKPDRTFIYKGMTRVCVCVCVCVSAPALISTQTHTHSYVRYLG